MPAMYSCYDRCVITTIVSSDFTSDFRFYDYYTRSCLAFPLIFYSTSLLLLSYYTICLLIYARHLAFVSPLACGVLSDSPGSSCPGHGAWSVWIPPVADQSGAAVAWISSRSSRALSFQAPLCASRVFLL